MWFVPLTGRRVYDWRWNASLIWLFWTCRCLKSPDPTSARHAQGPGNQGDPGDVLTSLPQCK
jgi:hypothetical protein